MKPVTFKLERNFRAKVSTAFKAHRRVIKRLLPQAEILHVGSTAITGVLTKGDLDILVRVTKTQFPKADSVLASHFCRNITTWRDESFSSFKDDKSDPPLGIQLTVRGGAQDVFTQFRDALKKTRRLSPAAMN
jgi:GrpB-like predicted nucleotidyltransferase (UPF0157 family)